MTRPFEDLDPQEIARELPTMWWPELDALAHRIILRMELTSEAAGAPAGGRVSSGKPESRAPHGDRALVDIHREQLSKAEQSDLEAYYRAEADGDGPVSPQRYPQAILRAAIALRNVTHQGDQPTGDLDAADMGVERTDWILNTLEGLDPHYAAAIESSRAGWITAEAIRRVRRRNGRHRQTGYPVPLPEEVESEILTLHRTDPSLSVRQIAAALDVGKSTAAAVIARHRDLEEAA